MRVLVAGGGPAGLFFALLHKRAHPGHRVRVVEQNPAGATFGFGVVFSAGALEFLRRGDPEILAELEGHMEHWPIQRIVHRDEAVDVDGNGFSAIARLDLLVLLGTLCREAGVEMEHERTLSSPSELGRHDLVVAADGVHSCLRTSLADRFRPRVRHLSNKFAWYGTRRSFECLTLTFRENEHGAFVTHHYRYAPDMSTFIVECEAATWYRAGLDRMDDEASRAYCEQVFAADLSGEPLVSNRSVWRNFPLLTCENWSAGPVVLIGDALRTGHFSIGSGTRLAMEDAIALAAALETHGTDVRTALGAFESARRPVVDKMVAAANASSFWYERLSDKMRLEPWQLAYDYMTRSGRMDDTRLRATAPRFMERVDAERTARPAAAHPERIRDPVPTHGVPEQYNASSMLFDNLDAGRGAKPAILCGDQVVTYDGLCEQACRVGRGLLEAGLSRGSRVLVLLPDTPGHAAALFGAMRAGLVPVLVNTQSLPDLVAYILTDSGAEAAIVDTSLVGALADPGVLRSRLRTVVVAGDGEIPAPDMVEVVSWDPWLEAQDATLPQAETHRDEMAFWMYSSGSTGRPKGVVHLHHDAPCTHAAYGRQVLALRESDVVFSPPKIFFAYGFGNSLTFPFSEGATSVLHPGRADPESVFATIERHRPTVLFGLPTLYNALLADPGSESRDLSSLRLCVSAAETLSREIYDEWRRRFRLAIVEGLGSTELLHIYLSNRIELQKPGASGAPVAGYDIRLFDPDGEPVARGEPGVMWVRGASSAPFYWGRPDKTTETMRGDWICTGDRFRQDEDGFYYFEGRADDLVKVSGQWVHPLEVERALAEHQAVRECAVLAIAGDRALTVLTAYVALAPGHPGDDATTSALRDHVKGRLAPHKAPRRVVYLQGLPKTGTDKIDRQALKVLG